MKKILIISSLFLIISCSKNNSCDVNNPLSDLEWMEQMVDNFKQDEIRQRIQHFVFENEDVYLVEDCMDICADALTIAYNCEGTSVCEFGGIDGRNTCPDFQSKAAFQKTLYDE